MGHIYYSNPKMTINMGRSPSPVRALLSALALPPGVGLKVAAFVDSYLQQSLLSLYFLKREHVTFWTDGISERHR